MRPGGTSIHTGITPPADLMFQPTPKQAFDCTDVPLYVRSHGAFGLGSYSCTLIHMAFLGAVELPKDEWPLSTCSTQEILLSDPDIGGGNPF